MKTLDDGDRIYQVSRAEIADNVRIQFRQINLLLLRLLFDHLLSRLGLSQPRGLLNWGSDLHSVLILERRRSGRTRILHCVHGHYGITLKIMENIRKM